MTDDELDQLADRVARKLQPPTVIGPNGNRILPVASTATAFDWSGLWKKVGPLVLQIVTIGVAALAAWVGIDTKQQAVQNNEATRENGAKIAAVHQEVKDVRPMMYGVQKAKE